MTWRALNLGSSGSGQAAALTADTGYFWFFNSTNIELVVKVLDGRPVNGRFWVFYGALSDVEYTLTVTDTQTGAAKTYFNPQGRLASVADTAAFSDGGNVSDVRIAALDDLPKVDCGQESTLRSESGTTGSSIEFVNETAGTADIYWLNYSGARVLYRSLPPNQSYVQQTFLTHPWLAADAAGNCLGIFLPSASPGTARIRPAESPSILRLGNRFDLQVSWRAPEIGASGVGHAVQLTNDTGYFWFFNADNVELMIKVLDGRPVNGMFWLFYGALSNVEYTITVRDLQTGVVKTYFNPQGRLASTADTTAFSDPAPGVRATVDRPDEQTGYQVKAVYALPSDGIDQNLDTNGRLATSVAAFQRWLERESGGKRLRMDTYQGSLDIAFVRLAQSDAAIASSGVFVRDRVEQELIAAGFSDPQKVYAVYYGGRSTVSCGGGAWPPQLIGSVAALYLLGTPPGAPPCSTNAFATSETSPGYLEFAMLHEIFHTLGAVGTCAPNHVLAGHTSDDPRDLMYAGPLPWQPSRLDVNRNDYYGHGQPCLDLARSVFLTPTDPGAVPPPR